MKYSTLGKNGPLVSNICLGTWPIGGGMGPLEEKDALRAIDSSIDEGINFLDTAQMYLDSEYILGKALKGKRNNLVLASKLSTWKSLKDIDFALENSLKNLQTDYLDLYQVHSWKEDIPMEDTIDKLLQLKDKGYFRYLGVSNFYSEQIKRINSFADNQIISSQPHYSILFRYSERDPIPQSEKLGIGSIVYSPIGRGLLSGKYKPGHQFDSKDTRANHHAFEKDYFDRGFKIFKSLEKFAAEKEVEVSQIVIAWTLHTNGVVSAICGAKNSEQAVSNAQAGDIELTQNQLQEIENLTKRFSVFEKV